MTGPLRMRDNFLVAFLVCSAIALTACSDNPVAPSANPPILFDLTPTVPTVVVEKIFVCKEGPAGTYQFTADLTPKTLKFRNTGDPVLLQDGADGSLDGSSTFSVAAGECLQIALGGGAIPANRRTVVVTELPHAGTVLESVTTTQRSSGVNTTTVGGNPATVYVDGVEGATILFKNIDEPEPGDSLSINKVAGAASVTAGTNISYTMEVASHGPGPVTNVVLVDTLPTGPGLSWTISPAVTDCAITSGVLTCNFGDMAAATTRSVTVVSPTSTESCGAYQNTARASGDNHGEVVSSATVTVNCLTIQGCTPGFWKSSQHFDQWKSPYATGTKLKKVFSGSVSYFTYKDNKPMGEQTMLQALDFQGGSTLGGAAEILLRAASAGLLNAVHPNVNYPRTSTEIVTLVNAALATGDRDAILSLAFAIDNDNNLGCALR